MVTKKRRPGNQDYDRQYIIGAPCAMLDQAVDPFALWFEETQYKRCR